MSKLSKHLRRLRSSRLVCFIRCFSVVANVGWQLVGRLKKSLQHNFIIIFSGVNTSLIRTYCLKPQMPQNDLKCEIMIHNVHCCVDNMGSSGIMM